MKSTLKSLDITTLRGTAVLSDMPFAKSENGNIGSSIQNINDLSMFYQAMASTDLIKELHDDQNYTIFAPTNAAFLSFSPTIYSYFYSAHYRPQIAALLRNHIIVGRYDLNELALNDDIQTEGSGTARIHELQVGDYTVDGRHILSKDEINGNIIYRIDGLLADHEALPHFQLANYRSPADALMMHRTIATYTRPLRVTDAYKNAAEQRFSSYIPINMTETTTVIRRTVIEH